jgi:hypothetical protein
MVFTALLQCCLHSCTACCTGIQTVLPAAAAALVFLAAGMAMSTTSTAPRTCSTATAGTTAAQTHSSEVSIPCIPTRIQSHVHAHNCKACWACALHGGLCGTAAGKALCQNTAQKGHSDPTLS